MVQKWVEKESQHVLSGRIFRYHKKIRSSPGGDKEGSFDVIECFPWVNILAFDQAGNLILVEQYRHGVDDLTLEIPGGAVNSGEDFKLSAQRELLEETGYTSDEWHLLGSVQANPAFMTNDCATYLAMNCKKTSDQNLAKSRGGGGSQDNPFLALLRSLALEFCVSHTIILKTLYFL